MMMSIKELEAAWNAKADEDNTWGTLSLEEIVEFVQEVEREECAKICDEYDDGRYANASDLCADLIRQRSNKVSPGGKP